MNAALKLSPLPFLIFGFISYAKSQEQFPPCMPIEVLAAHVQHKSEVATLVREVYLPINIFKARHEAALSRPCKTTGLVRSRKDGLCYQPKRLPK